MIKLKSLIKEDYLGNINAYGDVHGVFVPNAHEEIHAYSGLGSGDRWRYYSRNNEVIWTNEPTIEWIDAVNNWLYKKKIYPISHLYEGEVYWESENSGIMTENITDTPEFKRWFGNSKVVDKHGNPLILYHGGTISPRKFLKKRMGNMSNVFGNWKIERWGIFASEDPNTANEFSGTEKRSALMPLYARAESPIDLTTNISDGLFNTLENIADKKGLDGFKFARFINNRSGTSNTYTLFDADEGNDPQLFIKILEEMGYDSAIIYEKIGIGKTWVLFDPSQIKSAIGNSGKFDPNNSDIMKENMDNITITKKGLVDDGVWEYEMKSPYSYLRYRHEPDTRMFYLDNIATPDPKNQNQGHSKEILNKFFQLMKQQGGSLDVGSYTTSGMAYIKPNIEKMSKQYNVRLIQGNRYD